MRLRSGRFGVTNAGVIQLVECQLPKLDVAGSSPVARSWMWFGFEKLEAPGNHRPPGAFSRGPLVSDEAVRMHDGPCNAGTAK